MIFNSYRSAMLTEATARWQTMLALYRLQICLSPMALAHTVIEYGKASAGILPKQLLLNSARSLPSASSFAFIDFYQWFHRSNRFITLAK